MTWLRSLVSDQQGNLSSARAISFMAGSTLSISTLWLTVESIWRPEAFGVLMAFGPSLAGLAGLNYAANKWASTTTKGGKNEP